MMPDFSVAIIGSGLVLCGPAARRQNDVYI